MKLNIGIVGKLKVIWNAARESGVMLKELFHLLVVTGEYEDNFAHIIFNFREQEIQDLGSSEILFLCELICLVKKESSSTLLKNIFDKLLSPRNTFVCETGTRSFDEYASW
jgi:hypothetical protein